MAYPKIPHVTGSEQAPPQCGRPPEQLAHVRVRQMEYLFDRSGPA